MTKGEFVIAQDVNGESAAILQVFRLLTPEEQGYPSNGTVQKCS